MFFPSPRIRIDTRHEDTKVSLSLGRIQDLVDESDFVVWSDASAIYKDDGIGTWACRVYASSRDVCITDIGCTTATNTNRAELMGLLTGLRRVESIMGTPGEPQRQPSVLWIGDRQNLIDGIRHRESRKSDKDLWATVEYYETRGWRLQSAHVPRNCAIPDHDDLDRLASELRIGVKDFILLNAPSFPLEFGAL